MNLTNDVDDRAKDQYCNTPEDVRYFGISRLRGSCHDRSNGADCAQHAMLTEACGSVALSRSPVSYSIE